MLASIGKYILSILIDKGIKALVDCLKYLASKAKRDKTLEDNKKKLADAIASKDDEAIKRESENSLNGN